MPHRASSVAAAVTALLVLASCAEQDDPGERSQQDIPLDGGHHSAELESEGADSPGSEDDDAQALESEPEPEGEEPAEGFGDIADRLEELPGDVEALVVEDGETLLQRGSGEPAPLASVSKIYVLAALIEAIEAEEVEWMDQVELTEDLRSLPSGTLQDQTEGYTTTVYDVAHRMISVSDNTGTDMLMALLGREAVEDAAAEFGHHDPQLLRPFLSTRELFQLRWGVPELGEDWEDLDESARLDTLEEVAEQDLEMTSEDTSRHDLDGAIDWYANAEDVVSATQELTARAEDHPEVGQILTANPGLVDQVENEWWDSLSFKGGGLPGVVTGTWHAETDDGADRTVVFMLNTDDTESISDHRDELFSLALDALIAGTETQRDDD